MKNIAHKEERKQLKIKTEINGKGLTVHVGLLPVLPFMGKLLFRQGIQEAGQKMGVKSLQVVRECSIPTFFI